MSKNELVVLGMLTEGVWKTRYKEVCRVFSPDGIAPTLTAGRGGGIDPKILIKYDERNNEQDNSDRKLS